MNLNPFKKKKKLPFEFKVLVFVPSVDSMQLQTSVETILFRDPTDQLLYIVDTETKGTLFKELFPGENKKSFKNEELENIKIELNKKRNQLKNLDNKTSNPLNIKKQIAELEYLINKYEENRGTFVIQDGQGSKSIYFIRRSTGNFALHFDIHNNQAFSPTEKNSRDLFNAWKTKYENLKKDEKAPFEKVTSVIAAIVLAILVIVLAILVWNWLQYDLSYAESMRVQAYVCQQENVEALKQILETNKETSNVLNDFANNILGNSQAPAPTPKGETIK